MGRYNGEKNEQVEKAVKGKKERSNGDLLRGSEPSRTREEKGRL